MRDLYKNKIELLKFCQALLTIGYRCYFMWEMRIHDKIDIYSLLDRKFNCPFCEKEHYIPIKLIFIGEDAISRIPYLISTLVRGKRILILSDEITYRVAGNKCEEVLREDYQVTPLILYPKGTKRVYADEKYLPEILAKAKNKDAILTVGAGTITDLGKYVADSLKIPVICFPTAPSMNAYTSGVAALLMGKLKVTLPVQPTRAVITDITIISQAPLDLIKAGFADSLAKAFANADWRISSLLTGEAFCLLPFKIATEAENKYIDKGDELVQRDERVISSLMEGLNLGGISMIIAGKSSPASGGEHLISHFLDMYAHFKGAEIFAYHGLQVGIGVIISSLIYEKLKVLSSREVRHLLSHRKIDYDKEMKFFGEHVPIVSKEFTKKLPVIKRLPELLPSLWDRIKEEAFSLVYTHQQIVEFLSKAECPLRFDDIGVNEELAYHAITKARYIRGRFTILDIADEMGILDGIVDKLHKGEI